MNALYLLQGCTSRTDTWLTCDDARVTNVFVEKTSKWSIHKLSKLEAKDRLLFMHDGEQLAACTAKAFADAFDDNHSICTHFRVQFETDTKVFGVERCVTKAISKAEMDYIVNEMAEIHKLPK